MDIWMFGSRGLSKEDANQWALFSSLQFIICLCTALTTTCRFLSVGHTWVFIFLHFVPDLNRMMIVIKGPCSTHSHAQRLHVQPCNSSIQRSGQEKERNWNSRVFLDGKMLAPTSLSSYHYFHCHSVSPCGKKSKCVTGGMAHRKSLYLECLWLWVQFLDWKGKCHHTKAHTFF